jgi:rRNA maturation endonuclease Nob1
VDVVSVLQDYVTPGIAGLLASVLVGVTRSNATTSIQQSKLIHELAQELDDVRNENVHLQSKVNFLEARGDAQERSKVGKAVCPECGNTFTLKDDYICPDCRAKKA